MCSTCSTEVDENTFVASDQVERELIWDALATYRVEPNHPEVLSALIDRVSRTFSWVRDE